MSDEKARAIAEAHLELLCEGELEPTRERIARRAGVGTRELAAAFPDLESLFAATAELLEQWQQAVFTPVDPALPLAERVTRFCRQRVRLLEIVSPSARAARLREPTSARLRASRARAIDRVRGEVEALFGAELAVAGGRRGHLVTALTVATTWSAWATLRDDMGLDVEQAQEVLTESVTAVLVAAASSALR